MSPTREIFYHPFKNSLLGILPEEIIAAENATGYIIEDINLYHQPVLDPILATIFSLIWIIPVVLGEYLHYKILKSLQKGNSILNEIIRIFIPAQMIFWPLCYFLIATTNFIFPLKTIVGEWICSLSLFIIYYLLNIVLSHSFMTSLMRYLFIVHSSKVESYGKAKVKKLFNLLTLTIPLCLTIWKITNGAEVDGFSFINKCNGKHHEVFLIETSTLNVIRGKFCEFGNYSKGDVYDQIITAFRRISCMACTLGMLIMDTNIIEGFIYYRLFSYMTR